MNERRCPAGMLGLRSMISPSGCDRWMVRCPTILAWVNRSIDQPPASGVVVDLIEGSSGRHQQGRRSHFCRKPDRAVGCRQPGHPCGLSSGTGSAARPIFTDRWVKPRIRRFGPIIQALARGHVEPGRHQRAPKGPAARPGERWRVAPICPLDEEPAPREVHTRGTRPERRLFGPVAPPNGVAAA